MLYIIPSSFLFGYAEIALCRDRFSSCRILRLTNDGVEIYAE